MRRKTVISWTEVLRSGTLRVLGLRREVSTTGNRTVILSLDKGRTYLSVRAMTSDATRFTNSEAAQLSFVTSDADVPPLVIAPTTIISRRRGVLTSTPPATKPTIMRFSRPRPSPSIFARRADDRLPDPISSNTPAGHQPSSWPWPRCSSREPRAQMILTHPELS